MGIHDAIAESKFNYEMSTGSKPTCVYLGDEEITALLSWAKENQYVSGELQDIDIEGDHRPEVDGLLVYVVNDKSHINCA